MAFTAPTFTTRSRSHKVLITISVENNLVSTTLPFNCYASTLANMDRRYSRSEKEKWQAQADVPAKKAPVRILAIQENENLMETNRLSLIGRLTNTIVQKPRAVIEFMMQVWNLEGRITGRALGLDKFQIIFETENELLQVLNKGPYHYKRWMLILQRWEPVVSDLFPSNISFQVRIHGIPLHYWYESIILTIGGQLGKCSLKDEKEAKIWVKINGMEPLTMKMEIQLPSDKVTEVEFEYIKIEKHCFTCFSLFHEESNCPVRPRNVPPPKERILGITQTLALQRIEADKKRHDERRGYLRPDQPTSYGQEKNSSRSYRRELAGDRTYHPRQEENYRERSIISRTARSSYNSHRNNSQSMQYRVVERNRVSSGSYAPQLPAKTQGDATYKGIIPPDQDERATPIQSADRVESTPPRNLKERLGVNRLSNEGSNSGSRERRSALERLSTSRKSRDSLVRVSPTFASGRLQRTEEHLVESAQNEPAAIETQDQATDRVPANQHLGINVSGRITGRRIPIDPLSKVAGKKRLTNAQAHKCSPSRGLNLRTSSSGSSTSRREADNRKETS